MKHNKSAIMKAAWAHYRKNAQYHRYALNGLFRRALQMAWIAEKARARFAQYQADAAVAGYEVKPGDVLEIKYGAEGNLVRCKVESVACYLANVDTMLKVEATTEAGSRIEFHSRIGSLWQCRIAAEEKAA